MIFKRFYIAQKLATKKQVGISPQRHRAEQCMPEDCELVSAIMTLKQLEYWFEQRGFPSDLIHGVWHAAEEVKP